MRRQLSLPVLLAVLLALLSPVLAGAVLATPGTAATPTSPVLAARDDDADREKQLRAEFRDAMSSRDPSERSAAVNAYGEGTRELGDGGSSRLVARTLSTGLEDEVLSVRSAALVELSWGRDPETVLELLDEQLSDLRNEVEKAWTRTDDESRARRNDATRLFGVTCQILGRHQDDRAVDIATDELNQLRRGTGPGNAVQVLIQPLAETLLSHGSHESLEAVIKTTYVYSGNVLTRGRGRLTAERLHEALARFAEEFGQAPPAFNDSYDQGWRQWWKENEDAFPRKLGKLEAPVAQAAYERMDRRPYQRRPGRAERP